jgi:hypothetical protein
MAPTKLEEDICSLTTVDEVRAILAAIQAEVNACDETVGSICISGGEGSGGFEVLTRNSEGTCFGI